MRSPTSGTHCPSGTTTWLVANQAIAAGDNFQPPTVVAPGATPTGGVCIVSARTSLPRSATGSEPSINASCVVNGQIELVISNQSAGVLVALPANVVFDVMQLPTTP